MCLLKMVIFHSELLVYQKVTMETMAIWHVLRSTYPIYPQVTPFFLSQRLFNISKKSLPQSANIAMLRLREL